MTDRELLELAAKAAGYGGKRVTSTGVVVMEAGYEASPLMWNPLKDDGDALRLAVRLRLNIRFEPHPDNYVDVTHQDISYGECESIGGGSDPYAATRRAIVRAAAEIGRNMK